MPPLKGFTFGLKLKDNLTKPSACTPSPMDYSTSSLTRYGKLSSPAYSIKSKRYTQEIKNLTPSPLDYQTITVSKLKSNKSYSFGSGNRTSFDIKSDTPSPNRYSVPSTIGNNVPDKRKTGRSFSLQGRLKQSIESTSPGPGAYDPVSVNVYKKKQPAVPFTGHRRQSPFVPVDPNIPGPSQYNIANLKIDKVKGTRAPRAPFGIRHSPKKFTVFTSADIKF